MTKKGAQGDYPRVMPLSRCVMPSVAEASREQVRSLDFARDDEKGARDDKKGQEMTKKGQEIDEKRGSR